MAGPDANFQKAIDGVAQHLTSEDSKAVAASTATLTLMLQSTPLPADLSAVVQRAAEILEAGDVALQVGSREGGWCSSRGVSRLSPLVPTGPW